MLARAAFLRPVVDFIFPESCLGCSESGTVFCQSCLKNLPQAKLRCLKCAASNPFGRYCLNCKTKFSPSSVRSCFALNGLCREAIHHFKYEDATCYAPAFADALATLIKEIPGFSDFKLVFIPLAGSSHRKRGYNQAELLARYVGAKLGLKVEEVLTRRESANSQVQSGSKQARRKNVRGVFTASVKVPSYVIVIDDVITTGATVEEATKVLIESGASSVYAVSLAMADFERRI